MQILVISECSGKAKNNTKRTADTFLPRTGESVWDGTITEKGAEALHKELRRSARKNTSVICKKKGKKGFKILWVVGKNVFNENGAVPTNFSKVDKIGRSDSGNSNGRVIELILSIVCLFHDFGKSYKPFQEKLLGKDVDSKEVFRHELISLLFWFSISEGKSFKEVFYSLSTLNIKTEDANNIIISFVKKLYGKDLFGIFCNDLVTDPLVKFIGLLIVSHHKLLDCPSPNKYTHADEDTFLENISASWNKFVLNDIKNIKDIVEHLKNNLGEKSLLDSEEWVKRVRSVASAMLNDHDLNRDDFRKHILESGYFFDSVMDMFKRADYKQSEKDMRHCESNNSSPPIYANTKFGELNELLSDHVIGVQREGLKISSETRKKHE